MKPTCLMDAVGLLEEDILLEADARRTRTPHAPLRRMLPWAAAACLCALLLVLRAPASPPNAPTAPEHMGPPAVTVEGRDYIVSPYIAVEETCPGGFREGGVLPSGETYYIAEDHPLWVYVRHTDDADGETRYVRYVDARLRGRHLVCAEGTLYISLWSADGTSDTDRTALNRIRAVYGLRMEGDAPDAFTCLGRAVCSGEDTVPRGRLASNTGEETVYRSPDGEVLLVSTLWHTAADGEEQVHTGYNIYMRWEDAPF